MQLSSHMRRDASPSADCMSTPLHVTSFRARACTQNRYVYATALFVVHNLKPSLASDSIPQLDVSTERQFRNCCSRQRPPPLSCALPLYNLFFFCNPLNEKSSPLFRTACNINQCPCIVSVSLSRPLSCNGMRKSVTCTALSLTHAPSEYTAG